VRTACLVIAAIAGSAAGQDAVRTHVVTDASGSHTVTEAGPAEALGGGAAGSGIRWTYDHATSIPQTLAISASADRAWVGQYLNVERMQEFALDGDGTPLNEYPAGPASPVVVHAADQADLAIVLDLTPATATGGNDLVLSAYTSASTTPLWDYTFAPNYAQAGFRSARVSRDGSIVCCVVYDQAAPEANLHIFDGPTGALLDNWTYPGFANGVDLSDDGSLCMVTQSSAGRVIHTPTATEVFMAPGSGGGAYHRISGNGLVLALGGFDFQVYKWNGLTYEEIIDFTAPTSWFGNGVALSQDGSRAVVMSHNYSGYLVTVTRLIDVDNQALLGQHNTAGAGDLQDSISGAEMSDDGTVAVVTSWGTQDNAHPEVMIFDQNANMIGSIDTAGSPFAVDISGDGTRVVVGSKSIHANINGNGGTVTAYHLAAPCPWDCDGSGDGDIGIEDFLAVLGQWGGPGSCDFDGSGGVGIEDFLKILGVWGPCP
jgi:hypothetical protein